MPTAQPHKTKESGDGLLEVDWTLGWRYESATTPDGKFTTIRIPLTPYEARHPQEGYVMPESTDHSDTSVELRNMLRTWALQHPEMTIFRDLVFEWDRPDIGNYAPDIAVVPNVHDPQKRRGTFVVAEEGTQPCLIIEVVLPKTRDTDRIDKPRDYALLGIQEYVYIYSRNTKRGVVSEIVGHRLRNGVYEPIPVDEDGAVYCETVSLRIGVHNGIVWVEDATTGKELMSHVETAQAHLAAEERAVTAEQRAAELEAELQALRREKEQSNSWQDSVHAPGGRNLG
jgi:Uma2 family endonuclease